MRGVREDRQVLVCPSCQDGFDWQADLDHCPVCSSVHLVRRLGEAECRDCGWVAPSELPAPDAADSDLALEVEHALARVLGRTAGSAARG